MQPRGHEHRAGFTLFEALVALTVILAFAGVLAPMLFHARRITAGADGRIAAQILLRSLLDGPLDRTSLAAFSREGDGNGLRWRMSASPTSIATTIRPAGTPRKGTSKGTDKSKPQPPLTAYRLVATVSWAPGESVSGQTVRLAQPER